MLSFLNLPQEVRHEIYRLLFHTKRLRPLRHHNRFSPPPLPELGISFTSRIIHHEVTTYILTRCHISLPWPLHIHEPSRWSLKVADLRRIRHLNVDMDLARYIVGNDLAPNLETLTLHVPVWAVPGQFDFPLSGLQERRRWIGKYLAMTVHPSVIDPQRDMRRRLRYLLDRPRAYRVKMRCNLRFEGEKVTCTIDVEDFNVRFKWREGELDVTSLVSRPANRLIWAWYGVRQVGVDILGTDPPAYG